MKRVVGGLLLGAVAAVAGGLMAGCDIPTAAPIVEQRWILTAAETTLGVEDLLPGAQISLAVSDTPASRLGHRLRLRAAANGSGNGAESAPCEEPPSSAGAVSAGEGSIAVSVEPMCFQWTLQKLCPECSVGQPIPALDTVREQTWRLPPEVASVRISSGTVELSLEHDLGFTPIRSGELQVVALSIGSGAVAEEELLRLPLDRDLVSGTPVSFSVDFDQHPITVSGGLTLRFEIDAAGGSAQDVVADLAATIEARATVQSLMIDSAVLRVADLELGGEPQEFDLGDADDVDELIERFQQGTATMTISNGFPVAISGTITLGETERAIAVEAGGSTKVSISYSQAELQALLDGTVTYSWSGAVTSDGEQTFDASMKLTIGVQIDVTLRTEPE